MNPALPDTKAKRFVRCTPHLPVRDLQETLAYYCHQLGFTHQWTSGAKDGGVSRDGMHLLFAEDKGFANDINTEAHRLPLLWFVENIKDFYDEFQARKIPLADGLREHAYGLMEFAFIDLNGYYIRIAESPDVAQ